MQYIVNESNSLKRKELIDFITSKIVLRSYETYEELINSKFPIVLNFDDNTIWVCNSITSLVCAAQAHKILTLDELLKKYKKMNG